MCPVPEANVKPYVTSGAMIVTCLGFLRMMRSATRTRKSTPPATSMADAAMITVSEIGDIHRFPHPRQLMAYLGLVPSESSSGGSRAQGTITKCGNGHLRWIFNECAQHYRLPPKVSQELTTRQEAIPKAHRRQVIEISWRCQNRLHERGRKLAARGKTRQKAQVAMARELSAFVWEVMRAVMPKADGTRAASTARTPKAEERAKPAAKKKGREYTLKTK